MILHIVNKSPFAQLSLSNCAARCSTEDSILLIENGVYGASCPGPLDTLLDSKSIAAAYALEEDVLARDLQQINPAIQLIDYADFVKLCTLHSSVQTWL